MQVMTWRTLPGLLAVVLALFASGCAGLGPKLETPRLSVVKVGMVSADIFSQQFRVRMRVQNPNDRELPIKGLDYQLFLEGDSFAEGVTEAPFTVPALGETEFDMTVRTNFVSSIGRLLSRLENKDSPQVEYVISGKVFVDLPFVRSIPFRDGGMVDFGGRVR